MRLNFTHHLTSVNVHLEADHQSVPLQQTQCLMQHLQCNASLVLRRTAIMAALGVVLSRSKRLARDGAAASIALRRPSFINQSPDDLDRCFGRSQQHLVQRSHLHAATMSNTTDARFRGSLIPKTCLGVQTVSRLTSHCPCPSLRLSLDRTTFGAFPLRGHLTTQVWPLLYRHVSTSATMRHDQIQ